MKAYDALPQTFSPNACADLENLPGESLVSSLWRFAWRNGLDAKTLLPYCSESKYPKEPAYDSFWHYERERFVAASGWRVDDTETTLLRSSHEKHRSLWWSGTMRYCPICLEHLYHSYWHQCEFLTNCPFDGAPLCKECYGCGTLLPEYGFYRRILNRPYTCPKCRGPISGIAPVIGLRVAMQERADEFRDTVCAIDQWWESLSPARIQFERFLPSREWPGYTHWLKADTSLRHWVVSTAPAQSWPPVSVRTLPPLVWLEWKVRLQRTDPHAWMWAKRKSKYERLTFARQVYRTTLRRLTSAIANAFPFSDAEYRRYLMLPAKDLAVYPAGCNLHLLALIVLRMNYESFFSIFEGVPDKANLDESAVGFPYGNEFAELVRVCWRAQFIAEYASIYWTLVSARDGRRNGSTLGRKAAVFFTADVEYDSKNGDLVTGQVAFPAVDGLRLELFLKARTATS